jgi:hypothetical protein
VSENANSRGHVYVDWKCPQGGVAQCFFFFFLNLTVKQTAEMFVYLPAALLRISGGKLNVASGSADQLGGDLDLQKWNWRIERS